MGRQTAERAERTREAIIDAGTEVFFRQGVARASLDEVARRCGMTRGAVYWHFDGKHQLFMAVEERLRIPQRAELEALLNIKPSRNALLALERTVTRILNGLAEDATIWKLMTVVLLRADCSDEARPALERQAQHQQHFRLGLQRYFEEIVPVPSRRSGWTAVSASEACFAMVQGTILRALRFPDEYPLIEVGIPIVRSFLGSLRRSWNAA